MLQICYCEALSKYALYNLNIFKCLPRSSIELQIVSTKLFYLNERLNCK